VAISLEIDKKVPPGGMVVLMELTLDGLVPVDTLEMKKDSTYESVIKPKQETFYRIDIFRSQYVNLILSDKDDEVDISIRGTNIEIEGSESSSRIRAVDDLLAKGKADAQQLNNEGMIAQQQGDDNTLQAIIDQYQDLQKKMIIDLKGMVTESGQSLSALYGLNFIDMESEFEFYDSTVAKVLKTHPDHFWPTELMKSLDQIRVLAIGNPAPDFTLNDPDGNLISLSQLKGKYVLVDFWAAWCRPCREENPNVVQAYKKYGGENFEILGVSLDRTKEAWMKAISDDGLPWLHVSDLQYFNSAAARLYNINAIPATYLIDPQGNILAKDLRGPSLEAKLVELFGK
jgi:peroxiredoxin